jgi:hypothetical protein
MKSKHLSILFAFLVFLMAMGCSNGGNSPLTPSDIASTIPGSNPIFVSDWDVDGNPIGGTGTLGLFELNLNPDESSAELTPLRRTSLIDTLEIIDITNFMQIAPCTTCAKINSVGLDADGNLVVNIGLKHPFAAGNPANPPSGKNRADLHVFNVEGIVISNLSGQNFTGIGRRIPGFGLLNAHGYTDYLDESIDTIYSTPASIHPYIMHFRNYTAGNFAASNPTGFASVVSPPPSGNCVMAMGAGYNDADYTFDVDGPLNFIYAIGCTYAITTNTFEDRFTPEYRCPQHNKKAASEIYADVTTNNLMAGIISSTAVLSVGVVDINHNVAVGTALDQMFADSSVDEIKVEIPSVMTAPLTVAGNTSISGTGHSPTSPLLYNITITNTAGAAQGTYTGLVKVLDSYAPGQNTHPFIGENDGGKRVNPGTSPLMGLIEIPEFATYQVFTIDVGQALIPPVAAAVTDPYPARINPGDTIDIDATSSSDPDGSITLYEYDFDWDSVPANFTVDASNTTGLVTSPVFPNPGGYMIGLRVTDDDLLVDYIDIDVAVNTPPTADLVKNPNVASIKQYDILTLEGRGSDDPDGSIVSYEFDFDWDGVQGNFYADETNTSGYYDNRFLDAGNFTIGLRITDNDGAEGYDSVTLQVTARDVIFVDDDNSSGPWDGTWTNPFQYIQDAVGDASNGSTIWILPGIYNEDPTGGSSSGDAEITIAGLTDLTIYGEGNPVISLHDYTATDRNGIAATTCPGLTIQGVSFLSNGDYWMAIYLNGCNDAIIDNCSILPGTPGFVGFAYVQESDNAIVKNCYIYNLMLDLKGSYDTTVVTISDCLNAKVTLNSFLNMATSVPGVQTGDMYLIRCLNGSTGVEISKNKLGNSDLNSNDATFNIWCIYVGNGCNNAIIRNNLFYKINIFDTYTGATVNFVGFGVYDCNNVQIYNNTMDRMNINETTDRLDGFYISNNTGASIYNNIVSKLSSNTTTYGMARNAGNALSVDYCCVWSMTGDTNARFLNITEGTHGINDDPVFNAVPLGDYHLADRSPCKGTGQGGFDMGAYGGLDCLP